MRAIKSESDFDTTQSVSVMDRERDREEMRGMSKRGEEVIKFWSDSVSNDGDSSCTGSDIRRFVRGCVWKIEWKC